jgi:SAM-dependent methyltransferase
MSLKNPPSYELMARAFSAIASDLGFSIGPGVRLLDFGCGGGETVRVFRELGCEAYGVDVKPYWDGNSGVQREWFRVLSGLPLGCAFEAESFDVVISQSVMEHVLDHWSAFREIYRLTKIGGHSLHLFPGPWSMPVEPHMFVPLASVYQERWWFSLWARLGIRNYFQKGMGWREVVERNLEYSRSGINYLPRSAIRRIVENIFGNVSYPVDAYVRHSPGKAAQLGRSLPSPLRRSWGRALFSFREQLLYARKEPLPGHP